MGSARAASTSWRRVANCGVQLLTAPGLGHGLLARPRQCGGQSIAFGPMFAFGVLAFGGQVCVLGLQGVAFGAELFGLFTQAFACFLGLNSDGLELGVPAALGVSILHQPCGIEFLPPLPLGFELMPQLRGSLVLLNQGLVLLAEAVGLGPRTVRLASSRSRSAWCSTSQRCCNSRRSAPRIPPLLLARDGCRQRSLQFLEPAS